MRDSVKWFSIDSDSTINERGNLLLCRPFRGARIHGKNSVAMHSRRLQNQRSDQVHGFFDPVMLRILPGVFTQIIDPERILQRVDFL